MRRVPVVVTARSGAQAWEGILDLFLNEATLSVTPSRHGPTVDVPGVTVLVERPDILQVPPEFPFPEFAEEYRDRLMGRSPRALLHERLYRWSTDDGVLDQIAGAYAVLRDDLHTRSAVFTLWSPPDDLGAEFPASPVAGSFRVLEDAISLFLVARSVDVWTGFLPEVLAFSEILVDAAQALRLPIGELEYHVWSLHMYEEDAIVLRAKRGRSWP